MLKDLTVWLNEVVAHEVKLSTMQIYQSYLKNQIVSYLGEIKIQKLTPAMLDKWIRTLQRENLSSNTLISVRTFLNHALSYVVYLAQLIS